MDERRVVGFVKADEVDDFSGSWTGLRMIGGCLVGRSANGNRTYWTAEDGDCKETMWEVE